MTVGDLLKILDGLPDDMIVEAQHPDSGLPVSINGHEITDQGAYQLVNAPFLLLKTE